MTIAAGLLCIEGVVLAADTKESYGETHTYVDKIIHFQTDTCTWALAGSGESYLLDYMIPEMDKLLRESNALVADAFEGDLRLLMVALYESPSVKAYPIDKASDLYTQYLLAAKFINDEEPVLFVVNSTLVTRSTQLGTVIGCGPLRQFAEEMGNVSPRTLERAKAAALTIVYEAKRRYSDVAGHTRIVGIENSGKIQIEDERKEAQQELLLDRIRMMTNMITVHTLDSSMSVPKFSGSITHIIAYLKELHRDARNLAAAQDTADKRMWTKLYKQGERQAKREIKQSTSRKAKLEP